MNILPAMPTPPLRESPGGQLPKYIRFCLVGGSGVVVDMTIFGLLSASGGSVAFSKVVEAELAIANNFVWNELWTFRDCRSGTWREALQRFLRFNVISSTGLAISLLLLEAQINYIHLNPYISNLIA